MTTDVPLSALPGWMAEHLPRETTNTLPPVSELSYCTWGGVPRVPHNAHSWGEGMQSRCVGVPGIIPATSLVDLRKRMMTLGEQAEMERARIREASDRLERVNREFNQVTQVIGVIGRLEKL